MSLNAQEKAMVHIRASNTILSNFRQFRFMTQMLPAQRDTIRGSILLERSCLQMVCCIDYLKFTIYCTSFLFYITQVSFRPKNAFCLTIGYRYFFPPG